MHWLSRDESLNLKDDNYWKPDQAQRERIHLCSGLKMKSRLHQECYARSCQEIEDLKRRCYREENGVSRTASLLRDQIRKLQERLEFIKDSKIFQDPDSPRSFHSAHLSHHALIPSSPKSLAANLECSEIHERIWVSPEAFLIVNLPDECLRNCTLIQEIWQHHRWFREEKELGKVGVMNYCNQYLYLAFPEKQRKNVWTTEILS